MTGRVELWVVLALAAGTLACSAEDEAGPKCTVSETAVSGGVGECSVVVAQQPDEGAGHLDVECSAVSYVSNPPSSGAHYGRWADYKIFDKPVPRGFYVHSLEHGAVVFSYQPGCAEEIDQAKALVAKLVDPTCPNLRVILTPDPLLDSRWAASSWNVTLRANCFDAAEFEKFFNQHVGQDGNQTASEWFVCSPGQVLPSESFPETCGS